MESNKQERKNLMDDMPIDNRASAAKMMDYGKASSPVAMRMAATKAGLPMKESPMKMYGGKKGDESKSRRDYDDYMSPMAMRETPLMKALVGDQDKLPEALQAEILKSPAKYVGPNRVKITSEGKVNQGAVEYVKGDKRSVEIGRDYQGDQRKTVRRVKKDGTIKTKSKKISDKRAARIIKRKNKTHTPKQNRTV